MRVFVTGASGYIGGSVAAALLEAGHSVRGLVRSGERAAQVRALGIEPVLGSLADGAVGPLGSSTRGDGLIVPFPFNSQSRYVNLTARVPIARGLSALGRLAYTAQTTPEMPPGRESVASLGAEYGIGALSLAVEGRYSDTQVSNLSYQEKRVFARLARSFGTRF